MKKVLCMAAIALMIAGSSAFACGTTCTGEKKSECTAEKKAECSAEKKAECSAEKKAEGTKE
jgi:hypothetical protein